METNFSRVCSGQCVLLHPKSDNPFHQKAVKAVFLEGSYFCEDREERSRPDYMNFNVGLYFDGWEDTGPNGALEDALQEWLISGYLESEDLEDEC